MTPPSQTSPNSLQLVRYHDLSLAVVTAISGLLAEVDQHRDMLDKRAAEQQVA